MLVTCLLKYILIIILQIPTKFELIYYLYPPRDDKYNGDPWL